MKKNSQLGSILFIALLCTATVHAYSIRSTYESALICTQFEKPHTVYTIPANKPNNYDNVPFVDVKESGKYECETEDKLYTSTCSVSDFQEKATFDTNDGSASCSTPVKSEKGG